MLQLPVLPLRCFYASFSVFLILISNVAVAKAAPGYLQVLSTVNDTSGAGLVINTTRNTAIPAPTVHYYPQANGMTIMTADFQNIMWNQPVKLFPATEPLKGIRLAQLQSNPPVFRISIAGTNSLALTKICFRSAPGVLLIFLNAPADSSSSAMSARERTLTLDSSVADSEPSQGDDRLLASRVTAVARWHAPPDSFKRTNLLKGVNIVLDAGHGGSDPGAQRGEIQEKILTLDIVEKLASALSTSGARVTLTRSDDSFISVQDRVRLSLDVHPDIFLSVHINSMETNTSIHGIETYYRTLQSQPLAECVHDALVSKLEACDRGVRSARFYVINHTPIPAILAEVGFISNPDERSNLATFDYQDKIALALKDGVVSYLARCKDGDLANASLTPALPAQATPSRIDTWTTR